MIQQLKPIVSRSKILSSFYRKIRDKARLYKKPKRIQEGYYLIGNKLMEKGMFEPVETEIIKSLINKSERVVNIGANIGYYCCMALHKSKKVIAFEPISLNLKFLYKNVYINGWSDGFECYPVALSDKIGLAKIYGGGTGASLINGWNGQKNYSFVPVTKLDNVLSGRITGEKILFIVDIEGAELNMLMGASRTIDLCDSSIWFVEITVKEHLPSGIDINPRLFETFKFFYDKDYVAITADEKLSVISLDQIKNIGESKIDNLNTHNFIFVKKCKLAALLNELKSLSFY